MHNICMQFFNRFLKMTCSLVLVHQTHANIQQYYRFFSYYDYEKYQGEKSFFLLSAGVNEEAAAQLRSLQGIFFAVAGGAGALVLLLLIILLILLCCPCECCLLCICCARLRRKVQRRIEMIDASTLTVVAPVS